ncbi:MAG: putative selenium-dependent hydroxylase accessory protein YqeC, partial [bacterium]|nr:putative selenium-dependent hydroxylase accessory protein YqeC [bacterium]
MKISEALQLQHKKPCIVAFVGAGGKTTCMFRLAEELKKLGMKVVVTTTTKIWYPEAFQYDKLIIQSKAEDVFKQMTAAAPGSVTVIAKDVLEVTGKLKGFAPEFLDKLLYTGSADCILVEADGSKNRAVKAPGEHEPVLPKRTNILLGLSGFDCYGKVINRDAVFRISEFCKVSGKSAGEKIDAKALLSLVNSESGLFKAAPTNARKVWILNKVDDNDAFTVAERIGRYIFSQALGLDAVILSALHQEKAIKKVFRQNRSSPCSHED